MTLFVGIRSFVRKQLICSVRGHVFLLTTSYLKKKLTCSAMHAHFGGLGHRGDGVRDHSS